MEKDTLPKRLLIGLSLTIVIFAASILLGQALRFETDIIPTSFVTHALMLVLSVALIVARPHSGLLSRKIRQSRLRHHRPHGRQSDGVSVDSDDVETNPPQRHETLAAVIHLPWSETILPAPICSGRATR